MNLQKFKILFVLAIFTISVLFSPVANMATISDFDDGGHEFIITETIPATVCEDGSRTFYCLNCSMVFVEVLHAMGCQWGSWVVEVEATCTGQGLARTTCSADSSHTRTDVIPATGHDFVREYVEGSCTEPRRYLYTCSVCGEVDREYIEEIIGHRYVRSVTREASCESDGELTITCEYCDYSRTESYGEPLGHHFVETIGRIASCGEEGELLFACERCEESYTEPIPALSHNWSDWIIELEPEEGVEGKRYRFCYYCNERIEEAIPALPIVPIEENSFGMEEVAVVGANLVTWGVFFFLLFGEVSWLLWRRRKKKSILREIEYERNKGDGYEPV